MMSDYLHECLERHGDVTRKLYGKRQDLREVERRTTGVRQAGHLTWDDVKTVRDAELWKGGEFWQWPTCEEFDRRRKRRPLEDLSNLPYGQREIVDGLLDIFRHIEPVSVVLRFVNPKNYGILSPPVEKLLEIGPARDPRDKYLRYVGHLQKLRNKCGFKTAAEVDMALWVLSKAVEATKSDSDRIGDVAPEYKTWADKFRDDETLRSIRVGNLAGSLFDVGTMAELAEALASTAPGIEESNQLVLAAQIAGIEFEKAVMKLACKFSIGCDDGRGRPLLGQAVDELIARDCSRNEWERAVKTRNRAIHRDDLTGNSLNRGEVRNLLRAMREAIDRAR